VTVAELRELLAKATPGPWGEWSNTDDYSDPKVYEVGLMGPLRMYNDGSGGCTNDLVCETTRATYPEGAADANATLIAAMRNNFEALLDLAARAKIVVAGARRPAVVQPADWYAAIEGMATALAKLENG